MWYLRLSAVLPTLLQQFRWRQRNGIILHGEDEHHLSDLIRTELYGRILRRSHVSNNIIITAICKQAVILQLKSTHVVQHCLYDGQKRVVDAHNCGKCVRHSRKLDWLGLGNDLASQTNDYGDLQPTHSRFVASFCIEIAHSATSVAHVYWHHLDLPFMTFPAHPTASACFTRQSVVLHSTGHGIVIMQLR